MKRSPRWMVVFAVVVMMSSWSPGGASAFTGPIALPEPGGRTTGEPEGGSGGKNYRVPPGMYVLVPIGGTVWTVRFPVALLSFHRASSGVSRMLTKHD